MKKVTDLKENEVIHCTNKSDSESICKLMYTAGLKYESGKSYREYNLWEPFWTEICYYPYKGRFCFMDWAKSSKYKIYPASDFIIDSINYV